jgi:GDPmannose 4,6-dehydratase
LDAERDWGHAKDYVEGMWLMLQQNEPDDFVLATGKKISVRKFIELSFKEVGIELEWKGSDVNEKAYNKANGKVLVEIDPKYFRPTEVDLLIGDPTKAKTKLGWEAKYSVEDLLKEMVKSDVELFKRDKYLLEGGHKIIQQHE